MPAPTEIDRLKGEVGELRRRLGLISTVVLSSRVTELESDLATEVAALAAHLIAGDPHSQYAEDTDLADYALLTDLSDHFAADDHTQYLNLARHSNVHAYLRGTRITSAQSVNDNSLTTVVFNELSEEDDPDDCFDLNTSTGVITINTAGLYLLTATGAFNNTAVAYTRQLMRFLLDGATQIMASDWWARNTLGGSNMAMVQVWPFDTSDTIEVQVLQDNSSNTAQDFGIGASFSITRLK